MKKRRLFPLLLFILIIVSACSSDSKSDADYGYNDSAENGFMHSASEFNEVSNKEMAEAEESEEFYDDNSEAITTNRMIIHQANLSVKVKNLEDTQLKIEKKVEKHGGYVVEANVYKENEEHVSGFITVRIPEKHFQTFLTDTEDVATEVIERNVSGQDITEEYVDLESRLKSKKVVEERLLAFMKEAKKTEDLLTISTDLAKVQEEIEVVTGKMKYFDNQVAYSTVHVSMYEAGVKIPELENKNLDTWEKTKKQLATSINFIFTAGSGIFVFIVGNLPIILLLLLISTIVYMSLRKKRSE